MKILTQRGYDPDVVAGNGNGHDADPEEAGGDPENAGADLELRAQRLR